MPYCSLRKTVKLECSSCVHARWGKGGGGVLPYMAYTGMCSWTGYGFRPLCPKQGI